MDSRHSHRRGSTAQHDFKTTINAAVYRSITDDTYQIDPPKLSSGLWDYISIQNRDNREESERLEFLGDALMDACIAIEMYRMLPNGNPHKYTEVCSVLHSNFTFSHLVHKMGIRISADTKSIGDVFETMIGAYFTEKGFQALHDWVKRNFESLIDAAAVAFDQHHIHIWYLRAQRAKPNLAHTNSLSDSSSRETGAGSAPLSPGDSKGKRRSCESTIRTSNAASTPTVQQHTTSINPQSRPPESIYSDVCTTGHESISDHPSSMNFSSQTPEKASSTSQYQSRQRHSLSDSESDNSESEQSDALPEFWEALLMDDGKVLYIDHRTENTSWERPRRGHSRFTLANAESAWTARLVSPLPPVPASPNSDTLPRAEGHEVERDKQVYPTVIADLLRDGYVVEEADDVNHSSSLGDIGEFCEEVQTDDGHTYYVDHPAGTIIRR